jgi:photosystem II stability/assembly factor-like uncharacterized protein
LNLTYKLFVLLIVCAAACNTTSETRENSPSSAWQKLGPGGGGATFIPTFSYQSPSNFLIKCDMTGSYITNNGGTSYHQVNFANGASAFAFDPNNKNTIYIGASFLNRSTDGGKTWEQIFPKKEDIVKETYFSDHASYSATVSDTSLYNTENDITAIRIDPSDSKKIFVAIGSTLLYSSDNGSSWKKFAIGENINSLYTGRNNELYIFTVNGIHSFNKSSNKITSIELPAEMKPVFSYSAGMLKNSSKFMMYALHHNTKQPIEGEFGYSEIWSSDNGGRTWNRIMDTIITNAASNINPSYSMIACAEADAAQVYVVCNRYEQKSGGKAKYWYGALKSSDAGKSWHWTWKGGGGSGQYGVKDGIGVQNLTDAWAEKAFGGEYIRLMDVGVYPNDGNTAIVTDWYRTMKTTDGGKTWNQVYSQPQPDSSYSSNGMDVTTTYGVHFDPFNKNHVAVSYTDIGYHHSFNGGKSWLRSTTGVPAEWINTCYWVVFDPDVKDKLWSVWSGMHDIPRGKMTRDPKWKNNAKGGVCVSEDGGRTWKPTVEGMGTNSPATAIVLDKKSPKNQRTLYAAVYSKGVFKSTDDGKTWQLKNNGIGSNTAAFELTLADNGNLFLTVSAIPQHKNGQKGREFYSGAVYRSTDGAETWQKLNVTDGLLFPNGIGIDTKDPNRIYLGCWADISISDLIGSDMARATGGNDTLHMKGGIFLSEDGGNTWKQIFDENQYVYDVTPDPYHEGRVYCNTFNRASYRSDDFGKTWNRLKDYDFHWGHRVVIDENDHDKVFITTFGSSVWHGVPEADPAPLHPDQAKNLQ